MNDMVIISVDDHMSEPPEMFDKHLSGDALATAPKFKTTADGTSYWEYQDRKLPSVGLNAVVGRVPEEFGMEPTSLDQLREGVYNVDARVDDMNVNGIASSLCFGSFVSFDGSLFAKVPDKDQALVHLRAYNDWHVDEWCGSAPGRFIPMGIPVIWDAELAAAEVRRLAEKGVHSITFSENPAVVEYPSFHSDYWDPLWKALTDTDTVLSIHLGSSGKLAFTAPDAPIDVMITLQPMNICSAAADLLWSRVLKEHPSIKIALSEGGTGWIPYFLDRLDRTYDMHHMWTGQNFGGKLPSEVFRQHFLTCFISDPVGIKLRHDIGIDNIAWECDYPHSDSSWPEAPEELVAVTTEVPDDELDKITHLNAMKWYSYDPFSHIPKEEATVAALRAKAADHDVKIRPFDKGRFERHHQGIDLGNMVQTANA
jgi:predicted TIM-barrel fold metal-dependent hydrolase